MKSALPMTSTDHLRGWTTHGVVIDEGIGYLKRMKSNKRSTKVSHTSSSNFRKTRAPALDRNSTKIRIIVLLRLLGIYFSSDPILDSRETNNFILGRTRIGSGGSITVRRRQRIWNRRYGSWMCDMSLRRSQFVARNARKSLWVCHIFIFCALSR